MAKAGIREAVSENFAIDIESKRDCSIVAAIGRSLAECNHSCEELTNDSQSLLVVCKQQGMDKRAMQAVTDELQVEVTQHAAPDRGRR